MPSLQLCQDVDLLGGPAVGSQEALGAARRELLRAVRRQRMAEEEAKMAEQREKSKEKKAKKGKAKAEEEEDKAETSMGGVGQEEREAEVGACGHGSIEFHGISMGLDRSWAVFG